MKDIIEKLKESNKVECKLAKNTFPKEALATYSAFANTDGGVLFLGIKEEGKDLVPVGVANPDKVKKEMFDALNNPQKVSRNLITDEMVKEGEIDEKVILMVKIPRANYKEKPIYLNGNPNQCYKRNYEGDYRCSAEEVKIMMRDSSEDTLDNTLVEGFELDDLDQKSISSYRQRFSLLKPEHAFNEMDTVEFLLKIGALRKNRSTKKNEATLAGILVFGKIESIKEVLPHFHLEYLDKSNPQDERWKDRIIYDGSWGEGNLYNFFFLVINRLYSSVERGFSLEDDKITRTELSDVQVALREAFVNAIIHADYRIEEAVKITRYPNYFEFENPGSLRISRQEFFRGEHSKPRNHIIQDIFRLLNLCERAGSGVPKILKAVREKSYKYPDIEEKDGRFILRFWDTSEIENATDLDDQEKDILKHIMKYKQINNKTAREGLSMTKHEATDTFNRLLEKEYIEKKGTGRGTFYVMKYSEEKQRMKLLGDISEILEALKKSV